MKKRKTKLIQHHQLMFKNTAVVYRMPDPDDPIDPDDPDEDPIVEPPTGNGNGAN